MTEENQVTAISDGVSFQDVLTSYGDYRANEATNTSVRNYEEKHGLKDGKPVNKEDEGKGGNDDGKLSLTKEELAALVDEKVTEAIKPFKEKEAATARQTSIANEMKALGVN
ncbi:MAG: hypothetical protein LIP01_11810 [Tannerellaceae bacterium]|nr:hypothetical protein [Tannerellaceae bacterium]